MRKKTKFPITLEELSQLLAIVVWVLMLDLLLFKWIPTPIVEFLGFTILVLAVIFLAWYNSRKDKTKNEESISFEDFKKFDLRVAKVIGVEKIKGSEKLLKLEIDLGEEKREIAAGIAQFYSPEDLINREIVVVANLEPKKLIGIESQGMVLAADFDGRAVLLKPDQEVPAGTEIR